MLALLGHHHLQPVRILHAVRRMEGERSSDTGRTLTPRWCGVTPGQLSLDDARPATLTEAQRAVLRAFDWIVEGTDDALARWYTDPQYGMNRPMQRPSGLRTRRAELVDMGLIANTGRKASVPTSSRKATVWAITDAGRRAL